MGLAAIVSDIDGNPILYAERSEPIEAADSGWQFSGTTLGGNIEGVQVWSLEEVLEYEPSLRKFAEMPVGTKLIRSSGDDLWEVVS